MLLQVLKRENPNVCKFRKENNTLQSKQSERQIDPKENEQDKEWRKEEGRGLWHYYDTLLVFLTTL